MVISKTVLDADYIISLPVFKTHLRTIITGALKNTFGYVAGACKARLHLEARTTEAFARAVCDVHQVRPPDLNILDAVTGIEGNGPCHGGHQRKIGRLIAGTDAAAVDAVMARMMGVDPFDLPVQKEALARDMGVLDEKAIDVRGGFVQIPDFKMPVTFQPKYGDAEIREEIGKLYPKGMMEIRTEIKPQRDEDTCVMCGDCATNCPADAITLDPEFHIDDRCIACYCCVELCPEGSMEVPDVEAYRHY
jgi:ferredoxin